MALQSGSRVGPYEILSLVGAGGQGEVYKAKDTRLDRIVAVKVLSSHLTGNERLRERFGREARAISRLSHPHICTLYDVGREGDRDYLIMEFLEGETPAERLRTKGRFTPEEALHFAIQIADALAAAHRAGVVHRDVKPSNFIITKLGIKLLDCGLAKLRAPFREGEDLSALPTKEKPLTEEGAILGTFQTTESWRNSAPAERATFAPPGTPSSAVRLR